MEATDILMSEHRVIERVIAAMLVAADRLEKGEPVRIGFFTDAASFITGFADGCHHKKEEGVLFPTMSKFGVPVEGGPIGVMLHDHEQGRVITREIREAAQKAEAGDREAYQCLSVYARGYATLLRLHIHKEDSILFPMANRVIPPAEQGHVTEGFEHVEHEETGEGIHEKYLALAEKLEKEVGLA